MAVKDICYADVLLFRSLNGAAKLTARQRVRVPRVCCWSAPSCFRTNFWTIRRITEVIHRPSDVGYHPIHVNRVSDSSWQKAGPPRVEEVERALKRRGWPFIERPQSPEFALATAQM